MWSDVLFGAAATVFFVHSLGALWHMRWAHRLPSLNDLTRAGENVNTRPIRCSVVIAARDEAERIEQTVRHALAQQGVQLEIHVVDDRSEDGTDSILRRIANEDSRVKVHRVDVLPEGWLGKCHACYLGAEAAQGDWILFTDGDCWLKPDVISRALIVAERENVDHIALTPGVAPESAAARAWHIAFLISIANWISGVNRDRPKSYLGIGAFNLIRTPVYRACGGYEALRLTVVDDIKLGLLVRRCGKRTRAFIGGDDTECHWGKTALSMIKIMEKNYFAAIEYRTAAVFTLFPLISLFWLGAIVGPFTGTLLGFVAGAALGSTAIPAILLARQVGWSWTAAVVTPFIYPLLFYAILNSAYVTLRQGGIRWRNTFYSLKTLRAGTVK